MVARIRVVDSHTEGEPTRIVISGGPDLGTGSVAERVARFRERHDRFRQAIVGEPRGSGVLVGGLLVPPVDRSAVTGVIFFDDATYLGMCGHGTIGLLVTLAHLGRIRPGRQTVETPAGTVAAVLGDHGLVSVRNVLSYRSRKDVAVPLAEGGEVVGDVAWGGNWFFLVKRSPIELTRANVERLTAYARSIRSALALAGVQGDEGAGIEHVALSGPPADPRNSARQFVLCPGAAYDRSPCGTGTSATMAARYADGLLQEREVWRQEGILGTVFEGTVVPEGRGVRPTISGTAHVTGEADLLVDEDDPFAWGIPG
jgi:4-hydroxyproline epimerase